ncbi:MAG TPA: hypothetical protein VJH70_01725 [Candidatus Paceibacterota bacterium]
MPRHQHQSPLLVLLLYWIIALGVVVLIGGWNPLTRQILGVQVIPMALSVYTFSKRKA